jgi:hypothetical protein
MPSPNRREELIAETATLVYLLSGLHGALRTHLIEDDFSLLSVPGNFARKLNVYRL